MIPLNGNVLVTTLRDQVKSVFSEGDSRRDLQYAKVDAVSKGSAVELGSTIIYNPRNLTNIVYKGKLKGIVHEGNIIAIL